MIKMKINKETARRFKISLNLKLVVLTAKRIYLAQYNRVHLIHPDIS